MVEPPDLTSLDSAAKDALILALIERINALIAEVETLKAENAALREDNAALRARLKLPPKTPDNSSMPPSQGHKPQGEAGSRPKGKTHPGAHRALHPNPTRREDVRAQRCPHCRTDVSGVAQVAMQAYDRIEIPEIRPDVTRVTLHGGVCPWLPRAASRPIRRPGWSPARPSGRTCAPSCSILTSPIRRQV